MGLQETCVAIERRAESLASPRDVAEPWQLCGAKEAQQAARGGIHSLWAPVQPKLRGVGPPLLPAARTVMLWSVWRDPSSLELLLVPGQSGQVS